VLEKITPLILTFNEAPNIARTLEHLRWARDIVVVDSFSDDETLEIVREFPQVRLYQREFDSHEKQWNYGLQETAIQSEWILALDADYVLTDEFVAEVGSLHSHAGTDGYRARFVYCVHGKRLTSGVYPPVTVLYRRHGASYVQDGHTQKLTVNGLVADLKAPILHDDRKSLSHWLQAQARYTKLEAEKLFAADPAGLSWTDRVRRWRIVAPPAMLFYCLILRGGVLDGWAGFYYAFQRALAELMLSLYLLDNDLRGSRSPSTQTSMANRQRAVKEINNPESEFRNS